MLIAVVFAASVISPHMEMLVEQSPPVQSAEQVTHKPGKQCTPDKRWCFELLRDGDRAAVELQVSDGSKTLTATDGTTGAETYPVGPAPASLGFNDETLSIWPYIIREGAPAGSRQDVEANETVTVGIVYSASTMYSGGGAQADHLVLYRFRHSPYGKALMHDVLAVPLRGSITIRACFSEQDYDSRRGACHDLYDFDATLTLDKASRKDSPPRIIYRTEAFATPANSRRSANNSSGKKLSSKDIEPRKDSVCSYSRVLTYNPVTARYEFDRPGPDCSDYTVP